MEGGEGTYKRGSGEKINSEGREAQLSLRKVQDSGILIAQIDWII